MPRRLESLRHLHSRDRDAHKHSTPAQCFLAIRTSVGTRDLRRRICTIRNAFVLTGLPERTFIAHTETLDMFFSGEGFIYLNTNPPLRQITLSNQRQSPKAAIHEACFNGLPNHALVAPSVETRCPVCIHHTAVARRDAHRARFFAPHSPCLVFVTPLPSSRARAADLRYGSVPWCDRSGSGKKCSRSAP